MLGSFVAINGRNHVSLLVYVLSSAAGIALTPFGTIFLRRVPAHPFALALFADK
jgi:hypothetical protein